MQAEFKDVFSSIEKGFTGSWLFDSGYGATILFPTLSDKGGFEIVGKVCLKGVWLKSTEQQLLEELRKARYGDDVTDENQVDDGPRQGRKWWVRQKNHWSKLAEICITLFTLTKKTNLCLLVLIHGLFQNRHLKLPKTAHYPMPYLL